MTDATGIPLAVRVTAANRNDVTQLLPLLEQIPPVRGRPGRPRHRPQRLVADRGYDSAAHREALRTLGIRPVIAERGVEHGSGLGRWRWVIERSIAWLHRYRRLAVRWEYRADIHHGFLTLACCLICWRYLEHSWA